MVSPVTSLSELRLCHNMESCCHVERESLRQSDYNLENAHTTTGANSRGNLRVIQPLSIYLVSSNAVLVVYDFTSCTNRVLALPCCHFSSSPLAALPSQLSFTTSFLTFRVRRRRGGAGELAHRHGLYLGIYWTSKRKNPGVHAQI